MKRARAIAEHLGAMRRAGKGWRCRCPVHGGVTLTVRDGDTALLVRCWAGCDTGAVLRALRQLGVLDGSAAPIAASPARLVAESNNHVAAARRIWGQSKPDHLLLRRYLESRGVTLPVPRTLRLHPNLKHPSGTHHPCMVGRVDDAEDELCAIHRTFLAADGRGKAPVEPVKMALGPTSGGAVRLAAIYPEREVVIGEGIETTLSLMQACGLSGWAGLSAPGLRKLRLPPEARNVLIAADNDRAGLVAAHDAAQRWVSEGRRVRIATPPQSGTDFNDVVLGRDAVEKVLP